MDRETMILRLKQGENPLKLTIEKWQDIVTGKGKDNCRDNCALCETYRVSEVEERKQTSSEHCSSCPVKHKTGQPFCQGSPWPNYNSSHDTKAKQTHALEVLEYLKSLSP